MSSFTGDKEERVYPGSAGRGGWFTGPATPPVPVKTTAEDNNASFFEHTFYSRKDTVKRAVASNSKPATPQTTPLATPLRSRFAFFSRSPTISDAPKAAPNIEDEFLNLDISTALFPNGPADPFSPSSFKNLLMNAEALLRKLQLAYESRTIAVYELTREKEAQADELEEAETRAAHLKTQLEDLGKKLIQQDYDTLSISNELAIEKQLRAEEKAANEKILRNIKAPSEGPESQRQLSLVSRGSRSSFESYNIEGDTDSVFSKSRCQSCTSSILTALTAPEMGARDQTFSSRNSSASQKAITMNSDPALATTKPLLSEIPPGNDTAEFSNTEAERFATCRGGSSCAVWDAVELLMAENKGLKERVQLLEEVVEDVSGIVRGGAR